MIATFLTNTDKWNELLEESQYDFYQTPGYLEVESDYLGYDSLYFYYENGNAKAVIPLLKRKTPVIGNKQYYDLTSPYGYPGILINDSFNYPEFDDLNAVFLEKCIEEKVVSAFLRMNPLVNNFLFKQSERIEQVMNGNTVYVNLKQDIKTIEAQYSSNHRRNIKKLIKSGFTIKLDRWEYYPDWQEIYTETMKRLDAEDYYLFTSQYLDQLHKIFPENLHLITVHDPNDNLCAGGLFTAFNGTIQYYLGGTKEDFLKFAPTKLMFGFAIKWGLSSGMNILHLGGGLGSRKDSLFHFKHGFSQNMTSFSTLRYIALPEVYKNLSFLNFKDKPDLDPKSISFFPLYRYK